jgi:glutamyl-tRNA synthetase
MTLASGPSGDTGPVRVRFAPSPTGRLHVGNLRTALMNWLLVTARGGSFILRIDDTDLERSTDDNEQAIERDLHWIGFQWAEKHRQSERFGRYHAAADRLRAAGLLYACYETEDELDRRRKIAQSLGRPPVYDRAALALTEADRARLEAEGRRAHWRFKLSGEQVRWHDLVRGDQPIETSSVSDPVLIREDGTYLYTLPSVVDDIDMAITHVVRGEDHVTNSAAQIEIFRALGAEPPLMAHTPLLVAADGGKLSKRTGALSLEDLRAEGIEPLAVCSLLAKLGTSDPVEARSSYADLAAEFAFSKIGRAPARFDPEEVGRLNGQLLKAMPYTAAQPGLAAVGADAGEAFWLAVRDNVARYADASPWVAVAEGEITPVTEDPELLAQAVGCLPAGPFDATSWGQFTDAVKTASGRKGKGLFMPLRLALTGQAHGPDMARLFVLIGPERARARLVAAASQAAS